MTLRLNSSPPPIHPSTAGRTFDWSSYNGHSLHEPRSLSLAPGASVQIRANASTSNLGITLFNEGWRFSYEGPNQRGRSTLHRASIFAFYPTVSLDAAPTVRIMILDLNVNAGLAVFRLESIIPGHTLDLSQPSRLHPIDEIYDIIGYHLKPEHHVDIQMNEHGRSIRLELEHRVSVDTAGKRWETREFVADGRGRALVLNHTDQGGFRIGSRIYIDPGSTIALAPRKPLGLLVPSSLREEPQNIRVFGANPDTGEIFIGVRRPECGGHMKPGLLTPFTWNPGDVNRVRQIPILPVYRTPTETIPSMQAFLPEMGGMDFIDDPLHEVTLDGFETSALLSTGMGAFVYAPMAMLI